MSPSSATGRLRERERNRRRLVVFIWIYFILLVIEGALRKWVFPEYSNLLLLVRDPVAAVIIFLGIRDGFLPKNELVKVFFWLFGVFSLLGVLQLILYGMPPLVAVYGVRTYFLHPPVIFVIGRALDRRDVRRLMIAMVILAVPIAWLMVQQFRADPRDWLNIGAGEALVGTGPNAGSGMGQMKAALGKIRPSGPFSFISGPVFYFSILGACVMAAHFRKTRLPVLLQMCGWGALFVAAAVSGSRSLVFGLVPVVLAISVGVINRPGLATGFVRAAIVAVSIGMIAWGTTAVQDGLEVFNARMMESGGTEELLRRSGDVYISSVTTWTDAPILGLGLGLGTNAGNAMIGASNFRFGENEWSRVLNEAGPLFGGSYLLWRVWLDVWLVVLAFRSLAAGNVLPMALIGACFSTVALGPWGQPTTQGFSVWGAGLCVAASRVQSFEAIRVQKISPLSQFQATYRRAAAAWQRRDAGSTSPAGRMGRS
jgi:hypothetical protein